MPPLPPRRNGPMCCEDPIERRRKFGAYPKRARAESRPNCSLAVIAAATVRSAAAGSCVRSRRTRGAWCEAGAREGAAGAVRCYALVLHDRAGPCAAGVVGYGTGSAVIIVLRPRLQSDGCPIRGYSPSHPRVPCPERFRCRSSLARNSRRARRRRAHSRSSRTRSLAELRRCQSQAVLEPPAQEPCRRAVLLVPNRVLIPRIGDPPLRCLRFPGQVGCIGAVKTNPATAAYIRGFRTA